MALRGGAPAALRRPGRDRGLRATLAGRARPRAAGSGLTWPEALAGRGLGALENYVVIEELARARAPELVGRIGINLVGPTLLAHGTPEQKERFLPRILSAAELWCQLFSEPDAGSDLASLRTRAVPVEGGYRVTGRKVWTSYAQFADWGLCLTRSDPTAEKRQQGITALVVDMHAGGVVVRFPRPVDWRRPSSARSSWRGRLRPVRAAEWRRGRGVGGRRLDAGPRAWHQPAPTGHPLPAHRGTFAAGPGQRELRRLATAAVPGPGRHRGAPVPAPQLALAQPACPRARALGPEGSASSCTGAEMSKRLHQTAMDVLGDGLSVVGRERDLNPGRRCLAALVALLLGVVHLRRHQRDPADPGGRARALAAPGVSVFGAAPGGAPAWPTRRGWELWQRTSRRSATRPTAPWPPSP